MAEDEMYLTGYHYDIEAAYNAILALDGLDFELIGGGSKMKKRILSNALSLLDKALEKLVEVYDDPAE